MRRAAKRPGKADIPPIVGLCHRCELRARFMEGGHAPRCECEYEAKRLAELYQRAGSFDNNDVDYYATAMYHGNPLGWAVATRKA